jgi:alpha-beta hydrolase superfamily lysophospholipase
MEREFTKTSYDLIELQARIDSPTRPKASVVIVHGLCEHYGRYEYLTMRLNAAGYRVYRFDHRGHGRSGGKDVFYSDREQIVKDTDIFAEMALAESDGMPVFMLGHSMGGFATAEYGTTFPGKLAGYVLSGAWSRDNKGMCAGIPEDMADDEYLPNELGAGVCSDPAVGEAYMADPLVRKEMSAGLFRALHAGHLWMRDNAQRFDDPALIMHGGSDGLVDPQDSLDMFREIASPDKSLRIYAGLCHEIFNEYKKDRVIRDTIEWLDDHVDGSPNGD